MQSFCSYVIYCIVLLSSPLLNIKYNLYDNYIIAMIHVVITLKVITEFLLAS